MTTEIQEPRTTFFLQEILLRPFAEGAERVNRAIEGVNLHHIQHPEIGLLERSWILLVGLCLMIPLINSVIWICMKTFGNPELLSNPMGALSSNPEPPEWIEEEEAAEEVAEAQPIRDVPLSERALKYRDVFNGETFNSNWTFETHEDMHFVTRMEENNRSETQTSFDINWNLKTFSIRLLNKTAHIERRKNTLFVEGISEGKQIKKELQLPNKPYPWIQQPTTCFRPFILSKQTTLRFYGVHPTEYEISECIATKEQDQLDPYGKVIKVVFHLNEGLASIFGATSHLGNCWFDPKSGDLLKMDYRLSAFTWGEANIIRD